MRGLAVAAMSLALAGAVHAETPHVNYLLQCQGCHLPDGSGTPGSVPALAGSMARFLSVPGGREFLVRVPGSAQSSLGDEDLAALLSWMVHHFGPAADAADFVPYTAEEVARLRHTPLVDVESVRAGLIAKMTPAESAGRPTD
ncbi:MAG: c-type cytochrome [Myxococcota bacterium]